MKLQLAKATQLCQADACSQRKRRAEASVAAIQELFIEVCMTGARGVDTPAALRSTETRANRLDRIAETYPKSIITQ